MVKNCIINGNGIVSNGKYNLIKICGTGSLGNDILAKKLVVNGNAHMGEMVEIDFIEINGTCTSIGSIKSKSIIINGKFNFSEFGIECEDLNVKGNIEGGKNEIRANNVNINGTVVAKCIKGDTIKICARKRNLLTKHFLKEDVSKVGLIEGKSLEIDAVQVEKINCNNIVIGKNSYVNEINCTGLAKIKKGAVVNKIQGECVYE